MLFSPLRKAVIAGAGVLALAAAAGVTVHATTGGGTPATLTASTATPAPKADKPDGNACRPAGELGAARQVLGITASVTGQTEQQILDQLRAGKSLNDIAGSNAATVEQQSLAKRKPALDKRVAAGKLDATREQTMLDKAKTALDKAMAANLSSRIPAAGATCDAKPHGLLQTLIKVTADKTGLTQDQVLQDLKNGQSIDQIAGSKAADIKATVLQMEQDKASKALDNLMQRNGLPTPKAHTHKGGGLTPSPSPAA